MLLEARDDLLTRASYVNQARIHTGFHYPRSFVTAMRSLALHRRFRDDFAEAVVDDFTMLYAIAASGSKVTPQRFERMFTDLGAPFERAGRGEAALFAEDRVAAVFHCAEHGFNAVALRRVLRDRLAQAGVIVATGSEVTATEPGDGGVTVRLQGAAIRAPVVINATYGQFAGQSGAPVRVPLKYEMAEVALIDPPRELAGLGVTVMDGPFFSTMPFPPLSAYSLTHVRYTPHYAWTSGETRPERGARSQARHMLQDAARYLPCLAKAAPRGSLYETKTVLLRNEGDDGRPILLDRDPDCLGLMTVLGGKLDNIYDLFEALAAQGGVAARADLRYLSPAAARAVTA